jgi:hypothetical protein
MVGGGVVSAAQHQHRMLIRSLIQLGRGRQPPLGQARFLPVRGGADPFAHRGLSARRRIRSRTCAIECADRSQTSWTASAASDRCVCVSSKAGRTTAPGWSITAVSGPAHSSSPSGSALSATIRSPRTAADRCGFCPGTSVCTAAARIRRSAWRRPAGPLNASGTVEPLSPPVEHVGRTESFLHLSRRMKSRLRAPGVIGRSGSAERGAAAAPFTDAA